MGSKRGPRQATPGPPRKVQLHGHVRTVQPLVIPREDAAADPIDALPETDPRMPLHGRVQSLDHREVSLHRRPGRSVVRRPRESSVPARALHRHPVLTHQDPRHLPPRERRYSSRFSRSLIAAAASNRARSPRPRKDPGESTINCLRRGEAYDGSTGDVIIIDSHTRQGVERCAR